MFEDYENTVKIDEDLLGCARREDLDVFCAQKIPWRCFYSEAPRAFFWAPEIDGCLELSYCVKVDETGVYCNLTGFWRAMASPVMKHADEVFKKEFDQ